MSSPRRWLMLIVKFSKRYEHIYIRCRNELRLALRFNVAIASSASYEVIRRSAADAVLA